MDRDPLFVLPLASSMLAKISSQASKSKEDQVRREEEQCWRRHSSWRWELVPLVPLVMVMERVPASGCLCGFWWEGGGHGGD